MAHRAAGSTAAAPGRRRDRPHECTRGPRAAAQAARRHRFRRANAKTPTHLRVKVMVFKGRGILAHDPIGQDKRAQEQQTGRKRPPRGPTPRKTIIAVTQRTKCASTQGPPSRRRPGRHVRQLRRLRLKAVEGPCHRRQIEGVERANHRHMKRHRPRLDRIFRTCRLSTKPGEVRMGRGKGRAGVLACRVSRPHSSVEA